MELKLHKIGSSKHYIEENKEKVIEDYLSAYYRRYSHQVIGHQIKGAFGIKFVDEEGIFREFNTEDKKNFKITEFPFYSAREVDLKFKNHVGYSIVPFTKKCRTSAFWTDSYLVATWFTMKCQKT